MRQRRLVGISDGDGEAADGDGEAADGDGNGKCNVDPVPQRFEKMNAKAPPVSTRLIVSPTNLGFISTFLSTTTEKPNHALV